MVECERVERERERCIERGESCTRARVSTPATVIGYASKTGTKSRTNGRREVRKIEGERG